MESTSLSQGSSSFRPVSHSERLLYLTDDQFELAMNTVGSCRYVYNKALEYRNDRYQEEHVSVSYSLYLYALLPMAVLLSVLLL
ncbi:MAG: helix-turn-helix domain-containing protein [Eubacteriales bacterium]|nr:helix-turn-helix domain-containing protein [Eubacteriales bacterium]